MDLNSSASPYIVGPPVSEPAYFYGRRNQINQFFTMLRGPVLQPLRVLGLRRSGKTSFLLHVARPEVADPELKDDSRPTAIAYVDLQAGIETPSDFYLAVADAVACSIPSGPRPQVPNTFPTFRSFSRWLKPILAPNVPATSQSSQTGPLRLVVLLDEFEILAQSSKLELSFFHSLRSLVTMFLARFTWVTASYSDLHALQRQPEVEKDRTSPFFNIFYTTPVILGPLEPEEIERLICDPAKSSKVEFSPQEVQAIQDIAGAMPYFLQAVAHQWFITRQPAGTVAQCRERVLAQLCGSSQIQNQLDHYWRCLTDQEWDCLRQVALGKSDLRADPDVEQKLWRFGLLNRDDGTLKIAGEVFEQWVRKNHSRKRSHQMDPSDVAPFVPIIVEATKFVFNEASKWIEGVRKKMQDKVPTPETTLALPITEAQFLKTQADLQAMAAVMDSSVAATRAYEIQGLVKQIKIHRKNLTDLESTAAKYSIDVPVRVRRQIEDESESIVESTARLVELLKQVYRK